MITVTQLANAVRVIADANPNRRYQRQGGRTGCSYWHDTEPGCIVGQGLFALGVPGDELARCDDVDSYANPLEGSAIANVVADREWITNDHNRALEWLDTVQSAQDNGSTWGEARDYADNETLDGEWPWSVV